MELINMENWLGSRVSNPDFMIQSHVSYLEIGFSINYMSQYPMSQN